MNVQMKKNVKKKMNGAFDSEHTCILELQLSYLYLLAISINTFCIDP